MEVTDVLISFLNLFVLPVVSVSLYSRRKKINGLLEFIGWYCFFISFDFIVSKIVFEMICLATGFLNVVYSLQYSIISLLVALISPLILQLIINRFELSFEIRKK